MGWSVHHPVGLIHYAPSRCYRGSTLLCTGGGQHAVLIDMQGRVCHQWRSAAGIEYGRLLPNGHLLLRTHPPRDVEVGTIGGASAALQELDWDSTLVWEWRHPMVHHDVQRLPNDHTLAVCFAPLPAALTRQVRGGFTSANDPEQMMGDLVQEVTPDGRVVSAWHSWQHLSVEDDVMCPLEGRREWTHQHTLSLMPNGDFLVSFRQTSVIGMVEKASGRFTWKWGPGQISHQHHPTSLPDSGRILLCDNGAHRRGVTDSRVIEVDPSRCTPHRLLQRQYQERGAAAQRQHADLRGGSWPPLRGHAGGAHRLGVYQPLRRPQALPAGPADRSRRHAGRCQSNRRDGMGACRVSRPSLRTRPPGPPGA